MIVGISGKAGAGKDTAAEVLIRTYGFQKCSLADPIKNIAKSIFDFSDEQLWGPSHKRNEVDVRYGTTPRHVLQTLGTEWARSVYPLIWIECFLRKVRQFPHTNFVVADVRFENEVTALRQAGATLLRIVRPKPQLFGAAAEHPSEREQDSVPDSAFDHVIINDGSIADLGLKVLNCGAFA